jgi:hypothetical protein
VHEVVEIGIADVYGRDSKRPRQHAKRAIAIAVAHEIDVDDICQLHWGDVGFGAVLPPELVASWQALRGDSRNGL